MLGTLKSMAFFLTVCALLTPSTALAVGLPGYNPGETVPDFVGTYADGSSSTTLYAEGGIKVLAISAVWCVPCEEAALLTNQIINNLATYGHTVSWIEILGEDENGQVADATDGTAWADAAGIGYDEVWVGDGPNTAFGGFLGFGINGNSSSIPLFVVVDENNKMIAGLAGWGGATELADRIHAALVPEPSTAVLSLLALGAMAGRRRRQN